MKRKMYLLERIHDSKTTYGWKSGERIWADSPCKGWRVVKVAYKEKFKEAQESGDFDYSYGKIANTTTEVYEAED